MDFSVLGLWAALSTPVCVGYAVQAANDAPIEEAERVGAGVGLIMIIVALGIVASAIGAPAEALKRLLLVAGLAYLAVFDMRAMAVPVWPALAMIALTLLFSGAAGAGAESLAAAAGGAGAFLAIGLLYRLTRGRDGLGHGDALVAALIGASLGFVGLAWSVAFAGLAGLAWVTARCAWRRPIAFVPALASGAAVYILGESFLR